MYTLFLTLRYLTRKKIVVFPVLVVWLCLMMMIIVTSILGGFVDNVRKSNRDLLGDIIISTPRSTAGWPHYEELQKELVAKFPEVELSTPVVHAFGLVSAFSQTNPVEVVGIDPAARSKVARFRETLFQQYISPTNAIEDLTPLLPATGSELREGAAKRFSAEDQRVDAAERWDDEMHSLSGPMPLQWKWAWGVLAVAVVVAILLFRGTRGSWIGAVIMAILGLTIVGLGVSWPRLLDGSQIRIADDAVKTAQGIRTRWIQTMKYATNLPPDHRFTTADELRKAILPGEPSFSIPSAALEQIAPPADQQGCILGSQILFSRDARGNFDRSGSEFFNVRLTVVPVSQQGTIRANSADTRIFTVVDDAYSGVYDVDSMYVYAPFETVQGMAGLRSDEASFPPRCTELLIKLKGSPSADQMYRIRDHIDQYVQSFVDAHTDMNTIGVLEVQTWDQKQKRYISAVENERNMMRFILGLMSLVVLVVIFLIFYMIVQDKTRDIGIIKAVGGSEEGVATIFLNYGLFVGLVGGMLGVITGVAFVTHTNEIHDFIFRITGYVIWDRSVYVFDKIPDTINPTEVAVYFVLALIAGLIGAFIPAVVAASEDPVKAVRYE